MSVAEVTTATRARVNIRSLMFAIVAVAGLAELAYIIVNVSGMPVYIKVSAHLDDKWIGIVATTFLVVEGLLKSPCGLLGDKIGRKVLILAGPMLSTITCYLTPHVTNPYDLVALRVVDGIGAAALWPAAFSLIGDHVPEAKRSAAMGMFNVAYIMGIALGPAIGGYVNQWAHHSLHFSYAHSKAASFYVASVLFALTAIVATILIPGGRAEHPPSEHPDPGLSFAAFRTMLAKMPRVLLMTFVTFLGVGLVMAYVKIFALENFHMSEFEFGRLLIAPALVIALLSVPLGSLGDKLGKPRAVKLGIGICAGAYWLLLADATPSTMVIFGTLIGAGFVIAFPAWMALVSAGCDPRQRGAVVGAVGTAQGLGAIIGVATSSVLYKIGAFRLGPFSLPRHGVPFLGCGVMLALAFLISLVAVGHGNDNSLN